MNEKTKITQQKRRAEPFHVRNREKRRGDNNTPEDNFANIRDENHTRSNVMVARTHRICQDDTEN